MTQLWSWTLAALGITALLIAASRPRVGWWMAICVQAVWVAYAVVSRQWGFIASAVAYAVAYARLLQASRGRVVAATVTVSERSLSDSFDGLGEGGGGG